LNSEKILPDKKTVLLNIEKFESDSDKLIRKLNEEKNQERKRK